MLFAGLSTCDPGNILDSIKVAKQQRVRVSIVGLAAEVHICRFITEVSLSPFCFFPQHPGMQHSMSCVLLPRQSLILP